MRKPIGYPLLNGFCRGAFAMTTLFVSGCFTVGPNYQSPVISIDRAWDSELSEVFSTGHSEQPDWWNSFDDAVLSGLIERIDGNLDLRVAMLRIDESRSQLGITRGALMPSVEIDSSFVRSRPSAEANISGIVIGDIPGVQVRDRNTYSVGIGAAWEVDVFGRVRRSIEAATANWQASAEDYRAVLVVLQAEVARVYINIRSLQTRVLIAESNLLSQKKSRELVAARHAGGTASGLDLAQADSNVATTESTVPSLRLALQLEIFRLSVLLGETPRVVRSELVVSAMMPRLPEKLLLAVPADMLRQRPDIRRAERLLAAQTARVGIATADLYPRFSLLGVFGLSAVEMGDLPQASARSFGIGPSIEWNVFQGGRLRSAVEVEDLRVQQALASYEQAVLSALEEVEGAISSYRYELDRHAALTRAVAAFRRSVGFAEELYKGGRTDFQNVLDAQRNQLAFEDQLALSDAALLLHLISLYQAMGGGWQTPAAQIVSEPATQQYLEFENSKGDGQQ